MGAVVDDPEVYRAGRRGSFCVRVDRNPVCCDEQTNLPPRQNDAPSAQTDVVDEVCVRPRERGSITVDLPLDLFREELDGKVGAGALCDDSLRDGCWGTPAIRHSRGLALSR